MSRKRRPPPPPQGRARRLDGAAGGGDRDRARAGRPAGLGLRGEPGGAPDLCRAAGAHHLVRRLDPADQPQSTRMRASAATWCGRSGCSTSPWARCSCCRRPTASGGSGRCSAYRAVGAGLASAASIIRRQISRSPAAAMAASGSRRVLQDRRARRRDNRARPRPPRALADASSPSALTLSTRPAITRAIRSTTSMLDTGMCISRECLRRRNDGAARRFRLKCAETGGGS